MDSIHRLFPMNSEASESKQTNERSEQCGASELVSHASRRVNCVDFVTSIHSVVVLSWLYIKNSSET